MPSTPLHRLHLLRHAKTEREPSAKDEQRTLTRRGREDARRVGRTLPLAIGSLDLVLCSPAARTRETAELVLAGFNPRPRLRYDAALYLAGAKALLRLLRQLDERDETVLVIGHNPGLHELAVTLAAPASPGYRALAEGKFPTTARASFRVDGDWAGLERGRLVLTDYVTPKSLE